MPSKRTPNAAAKRRTPNKKSNGKAKAQGSKARAQAAEPVIAPSTLHDILGVVVAVVAVAMMVALVNPSSALVAQATHTALSQGFGAGAILVPIALLLYAITFFLPSDGPISARAAIGLTMVVCAIMALLSLSVPGAEVDPSQVFGEAVLAHRGGYVGGVLAWLLLSSVGEAMGIVVLIGLMVAGVVVCGFSISDLAVRIRQASNSAREALAERREAQRGSTLRYGSETHVLQGRGAHGPDPEANVNTTFIGARKTTVLKRSAVDEEAWDDEEEPQAKKRHPRLTSVVRDRSGEPLADEEYLEDADADVAEEPVEAPEPSKPASKRTREERPSVAATRAQLLDVEDTDVGGAPMAVDTSSEVPWDEDMDDDYSSIDGVDAIEDPAASAVAIPDFLAHPKAGAASKAAAPGLGADDAPAVATSKKAVSVPKGSGAGDSQVAAVAPVRASQSVSRPGDSSETLKLPPMSILDSNPESARSVASEQEIVDEAQRLQTTLGDFNCKSTVVDWVSGPLVTTFQLQMGDGEKMSKVVNLEDDIALALAAESVRIARIPSTSLVGAEIPNAKRNMVCLGDVLPSSEGGPLEFALGRDAEGEPMLADLSKMPHLLVAGTTGSGKSVMLNSLIMSLVMRATPDQVRLILIDPKRVEFGCYNGLPHLYVPVVTEPTQAVSALQWAVAEMERRLKVFEKAGARNIGTYNKKVASGALDDEEGERPDPMPYLVVVVDELNDLMMVAGKDVETAIVRIAQLARAAGIHLVIATQRPSADVVTGLIKSNIDSRVALKVASGVDSRVIIDQKGAEKLLGNGDMLFRFSGHDPKRILGCYVSDEEIEEAVKFMADQGEPDYHSEILTAVQPGAPGALQGPPGEEDDPLIWEAAQIVVDSNFASTSGLQRHLRVGYARAGSIMDGLEAKGIVGPRNGSKPRDVLLDPQGLEDLKRAEMDFAGI